MFKHDVSSIMCALCKYYRTNLYKIRSTLWLQSLFQNVSSNVSCLLSNVSKLNALNACLSLAILWFHILVVTIMIHLFNYSSFHWYTNSFAAYILILPWYWYIHIYMIMIFIFLNLVQTDHFSLHKVSHRCFQSQINCKQKFNFLFLSLEYQSMNFVRFYLKRICDFWTFECHSHLWWMCVAKWCSH